MSHGLFHPIAVVLQGESMSISKKTIGYIVQRGGIGAFAAGAIAAALFGGAGSPAVISAGARKKALENYRSA